MATQILIIGAGGHANDIAALIYNMKNLGMGRETYLMGFLDDDLIKQKNRENVLGPISSYIKFMSRYGSNLRYVIGINDPAVRKEIATYMDSIYASPISIIHETAVVGPNCSVGEGSVLGPYSVLTTDVSIGKHVHLNTSASINQNSSVGDFCTLSPGVKVCGDVNIGHTTYLGANSTVINMRSVGNNVTIGAGGVVVKDIPDNVVAVGVPAQTIKVKEDVDENLHVQA